MNSLKMLKGLFAYKIDSRRGKNKIANVIEKLTAI